jgi:hypothetical protein
VASLKAAQQILITSSEGMGKTFLLNQVSDRLTSEGFTVCKIEKSSPKIMLTQMANILGVETKSLEGKSLTSDGLKAAVGQHLSVNPAFLLFDDAHLIQLDFRHWLKNMKELGIPLLLAATSPPRSDIFLNLPRIELQPLTDYAIREIMETAALAKGINLKPSIFAQLLERTGGNPMFAKRAIDEEFIGLTVEVSDATGLYFDILPFIGLVAIIFICLRFIGLGTNNTALYIFSGIGASVFMGFTIALRSLPRESDRL